ncbi:hypothetical protein [Azospirillum argentinense]
MQRIPGARPAYGRMPLRFGSPARGFHAKGVPLRPPPPVIGTPTEAIHPA